MQSHSILVAIRYSAMALGFLVFSSFGGKPHNPFLEKMYLVEEVKIYSAQEFFKSAYNYRVANKHQVPDHYYELLRIPNPKPKISLPQAPVDTPQMKRRSQVPGWILHGILGTETRSHYKEDGTIYYKDRRRGAAGERGPFQMRKICFDQIAKKGEQFWKVEKDMDFAEDLAVRYLLYLYNNHAGKDWNVAVGMYNTGPTGYKSSRSAATRYLNSVKKNAE